MVTKLTQARPTLADYLALDGSPTKYEFIDGEIVAMAGGTLEHAMITANVIRHLGTELRERPCHVFSPDARVANAETDFRAYPDAMVVCGDIRRTDNGLSLTNPVVIVEVLSDSTAFRDRGAKFQNYRELPSLQEYLLVHQAKRLVEHWRREGEIWTLRDVRADSIIRLASIGCTLPLDEIYLKVDLGPDTRK